MTQETTIFNPLTYDYSHLTKHQLVKLITRLSDIRKQKYGRRRTPKYGNINRGFTEAELDRFFSSCRDPKIKLLFMSQAYLGLRISEVVGIKLEDIYFNKRVLRIDTKKAKTKDFLTLHKRIYNPLRKWVDENYKQIVQHGGYIFFSSKTEKSISPHTMRNAFRQVCRDAGLNQTYGHSERNPRSNCKRIVEGRKLYRLTTHSLRHYFITKVANETKDPIKTQKLARHLDFNTTQTYIYTSKQDLEKAMIETFGEQRVDEKEVEDFVDFYIAYKRVRSKDEK